MKLYLAAPAAAREQLLPVAENEGKNARVSEQPAIEVRDVRREREGVAIRKIRLTHLSPQIGETTLEALIVV